MENWGAIFYFQHHVLFDPVNSTELDRQVVFRVVAHEMAHQWFGDRVTMAWWDESAASARSGWDCEGP